MEAENKKLAKDNSKGSGDARIRSTQHGALTKKFLDVMMEYKDVGGICNFVIKYLSRIKLDSKKVSR